MSTTPCIRLAYCTTRTPQADLTSNPVTLSVTPPLLRTCLRTPDVLRVCTSRRTSSRSVANHLGCQVLLLLIIRNPPLHGTHGHWSALYIGCEDRGPDDLCVSRSALLSTHSRIWCLRPAGLADLKPIVLRLEGTIVAQNDEIDELVCLVKYGESAAATWDVPSTGHKVVFCLGTFTVQLDAKHYSALLHQRRLCVCSDDPSMPS